MLRILHLPFPVIIGLHTGSHGEYLINYHPPPSLYDPSGTQFIRRSRDPAVLRSGDPSYPSFLIYFSLGLCGDRVDHWVLVLTRLQSSFESE